jgi:predicted AAA+ superfamily ATPase
MTAPSGLTLADVRADGELWGRLVESSVGAYLANAAAARECEVFYWRERNQEVDFVVKSGRRLVAIEVKTGRAPQAHSGVAAFAAAFRPSRSLLVGGAGIAVEEFLLRPVSHWLQ